MRTLLATIFAAAIAPLVGGCGMNSMPGKSFTGSLPPVTPAQSQLADDLRRHVEKLATEIGDRNVVRYDELCAARDYLAASLSSWGYKVTEQPFEAAGKRVSNLSAELPGSEKPEEILVVGAHYDSVRGCPAANDNGTGVAGVLEIARLMATDRPRRTVRFVLFVNEEPPFFQTDLMGSVVYARACKARGENVVGMISLETIGYYSDKKGSQKYPFPFHLLFPSTGNFIGFVGDERSGKFVREVIASFRKHTSFPSEGVAAPSGVEGVGWSDHWAFWQEGYPALMVTDTAPFRYPHYHEPTDTPDKIDFQRTARVVDGMLSVTRELAESDENY
jgi:Zn-dependent M28 family amino/carboxypeptidase